MGSNPFADKYNKASDYSETIASKTIDTLSQSVLILKQNKEHIKNSDSKAWLENTKKIANNFQILMRILDSHPLGDFGVEMKFSYLRLSMQHNLIVLDGCKDNPKLDEVINKFEMMRDYWIKLYDQKKKTSTSNTDLI